MLFPRSAISAEVVSQPASASGQSKSSGAFDGVAGEGYGLLMHWGVLSVSSNMLFCAVLAGGLDQRLCMRTKSFMA